MLCNDSPVCQLMSHTADILCNNPPVCQMISGKGTDVSCVLELAAAAPPDDVASAWTPPKGVKVQVLGLTQLGLEDLDDTFTC